MIKESKSLAENVSYLCSFVCFKYEIWFTSYGQHDYCGVQKTTSSRRLLFEVMPLHRNTAY